MKAPASEEHERTLDHAQRAAAAWAIMVSAAALFLAGVAVPAVSQAIGVTLGDATIALSAFVTATSAANVAYRLFGGNATVYIVIDHVESLVGSWAVAFLIYRSRSAVSFCWFFHFVQLYLVAGAGISRINGAIVLAGPLALVLAFAVGGNLAAAWLSSVAAALTFAVYLVVARIHDRLEAAHALEVSLRAELAGARVNEERARISQQLHDTVATELTALIWRVRELSIARAGERELDCVADRLRAALSDLRNVVLALRSPALNSQEAKALLERRCRELCGSIAFDFSVDGDLDEGQEAVWEDVLTMCFELVRNAAAHASARRIGVEVGFRAGAVLTVVDDGRGLRPVAAQSSRGGLDGLRRRVTELGGRMHIEASDHGTRITVALPNRASLPLAERRAPQASA